MSGIFTYNTGWFCFVRANEGVHIPAPWFASGIAIVNFSKPGWGLTMTLLRSGCWMIACSKPSLCNGLSSFSFVNLQFKIYPPSLDKTHHVKKIAIVNPVVKPHFSSELAPVHPAQCPANLQLRTPWDPGTSRCPSTAKRGDGWDAGMLEITLI